MQNSKHEFATRGVIKHYISTVISERIKNPCITENGGQQTLWSLIKITPLFQNIDDKYSV